MTIGMMRTGKTDWNKNHGTSSLKSGTFPMRTWDISYLIMEPFQWNHETFTMEHYQSVLEFFQWILEYFHWNPRTFPINSGTFPMISWLISNKIMVPFHLLLNHDSWLYCHNSSRGTKFKNFFNRPIVLVSFFFS